MDSPPLDAFLKQQPRRTKRPFYGTDLDSILLLPSYTEQVLLRAANQAVSSVLSECEAPTMWTPLFCTSSCTFLSWSFLSHILSSCFSVCWCCTFVLFSCCMNPQASLGKHQHPSFEHVLLGHSFWALAHRLEILSCSPELDSMAPVTWLIYGCFFPCLILANRQLWSSSFILLTCWHLCVGA